MATLIPLLEVSQKSHSRILHVPCLRLTTREQRAALRRLKLTWGGRADQKQFEWLVLVLLKLIEDPPAVRKEPKASRVVEKLRRRARMIDSFTRKLEQPILGNLSLPLPPLAFPPIRELQLYSEKLRACADSLAAGSRKRLRHLPRPETDVILRLIRLVKRQTGQPHFEALSILLQKACDDAFGMNPHRLRALVQYHPEGVFARAKTEV